MQRYPYPPIEIEVGQSERRRSFQEVLIDLNRTLAALALVPDEYPFGYMVDVDQPNWQERYATQVDDIFPSYRWLVVYPVTGGSEGIYLHVSLIHEGKHRLVYLAKSLGQSWDEVWEIVKAVGYLLSV